MVYKRNQVKKKKNRQNINIQGTVLENENNLNNYKILKRIQFAWSTSALCEREAERRDETLSLLWSLPKKYIFFIFTPDTAGINKPASFHQKYQLWQLRFHWCRHDIRSG